MTAPDALRDLAWVAARCRDAAELRAEGLAWVGRHIPVDAAILVQLHGGMPSARTSVGLRDEWVDRFLAGLATRYRSDFDEIMRRLASGKFMTGPTTRLEHWAAMPERQGLEEDMMFPLGLRIGGGGLITTRGAPNGVLLLARSGSRRIFTEEEGDFLASASPILSMGFMMHERGQAAAPRESSPRLRAVPRADLTARERNVVEYAVLGLSTREIGLALGTSPNTIRNQLASIFKKVSVASRAELVAVALSEGLVERR